jgi:hypothetical protein
MEKISNYVDLEVVFFALIVTIVLGVKYLQCWRQLKKAVIESGKEWPLTTQEELNKTSRTDLLRGYEIIGSNIRLSVKIIFTMKTDNPTILLPLRSMRRTLILFILFPFFLTFVLVSGYVFLSI